MDETTKKRLLKELKLHARAIGLPDGAADSFITAAIASATKTLREKTVITESDFTRIVAKELRKYNKDLAYVYQNHDKII